mmetsp:Transcript_17586/g.51086  ORF Transcript_17586/g.51086 Transcript_17586/m.51086 type:complete len:325 (+) Transcript_17586:762-1736(+)
MVVLRAELEVAHDDGDLRAGDHQDHEHEEEEAEDVVELVEPDGGEDEEELDEDRAEGEHAAHNDGECGPHVPHLLGYLARDLVGAHGELGGLALVAEVGAQEDEGRGDAEPEQEQGHEGSEGHRARGRLSPDEKVEHEENHEHHAGVEGRGEHGVLLPRRAALEGLEEVGGEEARGHAHEDEEKDERRHQPAAVRRAQEAQDREDHGHHEHAQHLHARARGHAEEHGVGRGPEDVAVDQLPPRLLLRLLGHVQLVVALQVLVQRAHHDHGYHAAQEEHNHQRVDDGEPVDLLVAHEQVSVPAAGPLDVRSLPLDVVCEDDLARL